MGVMDDLVRAREAFERREWAASYEALSRREPSTLSVEDFARLATAALLVGRRNDCVQALQRAYQLSRDIGHVANAARCAFWLAMVLVEIGEDAVSSGWIARAERVLDETSGDTVEHGYVAFYHLHRAVHAGRDDEARRRADEVVAYGARFAEPDLTALGMSAQGMLQILAGRVRDGSALLDEAMIEVSAGEVSTLVAGEVYCLMIEACQPIFDYGRLVQWTEQLSSWCAAQPELVMFTGQCAVHRGQIMRLRGAYSDALVEFDRAVQRYLEIGTPVAAGLALGERADVLRLRGDLVGAEAAYTAAARHGYEAQPGLALLWLAQGRTTAAVAAVNRLLGEPRVEVHRTRLLSAAVEILLAAGLIDQAAGVATDLARCAGTVGTPAAQAMAMYAEASVLVARAEGSQPLALLREARRRFAELHAAYEVAQCRALTGRAYQQLGDMASATAELTDAGLEFARLGARPAGHQVAQLLRASAPAGLTAREVEVLRLVAAGRSNAQIATTLVLSEKTVARHLSNIFVKIDVGSRTAAAAFAYEHRLV